MTLSRIAFVLSILLGIKWVIGIPAAPLVVTREIDDYWTKRANFIREEESASFGGDVPLQKNEFLANLTLMSAKNKEINEGLFSFSIFM